MPKINVKAWLIIFVVAAALLLMVWVGFIDEDSSNEMRAFLRELRRIL